MTQAKSWPGTGVLSTPPDSVLTAAIDSGQRAGRPGVGQCVAMRRAGGPLLGLLFALLAAPGAGAAALEPVGTFDSPIFVTSEPADSDRLLVVEQGGRIVLTEHGVTTEFLDLTEPNPDLLVSGGEQGLLSVALAPDYAQTGRLYVFYTRNGTGNQVGDLQIDEFTASGDSAPIASRRPVLTIDHEQFANHNGGQLQFGPDGYLYIATGDGGAAAIRSRAASR